MGFSLGFQKGLGAFWVLWGWGVEIIQRNLKVILRLFSTNMLTISVNKAGNTYCSYSQKSIHVTKYHV